MTEIYNANMEPVEAPDLALGWLEDSTRTVHHEAVEGVKEEWHYETIKRYPNGGEIVRKVIDVPGVKAKEALDEEIPIQIYHPYTQEELDEMEAAKNRPTQEQRIAALEEALDLILSGVTE